jgi:hypothetical protein
MGKDDDEKRESKPDYSQYAQGLMGGMQGGGQQGGQMSA